MNKQLCKYAVVRFSPFVETEEFANVGVLIATPTKLIFKLEVRKHGRITSFFDSLDKKVYLNSMSSLKKSLDDFCKLSEGADSKVITQLFNEIVRPRETLIRFSGVKAGFYEDPKESIVELFKYYVERNFVTKEYKEQAMEKALRELLKEADLEKLFVRKTLGDGIYEATFPFVSKTEKSTRVIKPLHLSQEKPSGIIDVGGKWLFKINELRARKVLDRDVLLIVDEVPSNPKAQDAYSEMVERFTLEDVQFASNDSKAKILAFAQE